MPEIRSITYFTDVFADDHRTPMARGGSFLSAARHALEKAGLIVQSLRLATQPFPQHLFPRGPASMARTVQQLHDLSRAFGVDYLSLGPINPEDDPDYFYSLAEVIIHMPNMFASAAIADKDRGIDLATLYRAAEVISFLADATSDGMKNLFFTAAANCPPWSPFFPVAYHGGGAHAFALAVQAADLANTIFAAANTPEDARKNLTAAINAYTLQVVPVAKQIAEEHGVEFKGLDFSLAPYPVDDKSLGGALEKLGPAFGGHGLVASASIVMNAIEAADFPSIGFSGLMLPILEDSILGRRVVEDRLGMNDLLLLSAVCGTGLDCIPLPGEITNDQLYAILLDVAALALRLDKPLTARLMPFPGKMAGDIVEFSFEYFTRSKILPAPPYTIDKTRPLGKAEGKFRISPR